MNKPVTPFLLIIFCIFLPREIPCQTNSTEDSLLFLLNKTKDNHKKIELLKILGKTVQLEEPRKSLSYYDQAYKFAAQIKDVKQEAELLLNISVGYYFLSELFNAMEYSLKAKELAQKNNLQRELAVSLDNIGMIYYDIGDKEKSSECYFASLKIFEQLEDKKGMSKTISRIGVLFYDQGDYDKAWEYYSRSLNITKSIKNQEGISANLNNMANVMSSKKDYAKALSIYKEALSISRSLNNQSNTATNLINIGKTYFRLNNYAEAMKHYLEGLEIFESLSNHGKIAVTRLKIGEVCLATNKPELAIKDGLIALKIGEKYGLKETIYQSSRLLHKACLAKNDSLRAYRYSVIENQWKDSLALNEKEKNLAKLEMQYLFEKKEMETEQARYRKSIINLLVIVFLVLGIVIILLVLNQFRLKAKKSALEKQSLENELDYKKKELILNVMSLMKKNEIFSEISQRLLEMAEEIVAPETKNSLKKISKEISKGKEDELWKEFTLRFKEVHTAFYDSLLAKFPTLSPNEQRLCAFLRLKMTSKEISELTGQTLSAIEIARHRIRNKLGLTNSEVNLVTFLSQI